VLLDGWGASQKPAVPLDGWGVSQTADKTDPFNSLISTTTWLSRHHEG